MSAATMAPAPMNTTQLLDTLRGHFIKPDDPRPGAVFLTEVTAPDRVHRADAIHVGLWASRGHTVDVCELKTSLADFKRELENPAKAEAWWKHSNTFWIVAPDTSVAPPDLLPPGWGLMVPGARGRRFKVVVPAARRDLHPSTALLAALLISTETDRDHALERQRLRLEAMYYQRLQEASRRSATDGDPKSRRRLELLDRFESLAGFTLDDYDFGNSASAKTLAEVLRTAVIEKRAARDMGRMLSALDGDVERLREALAVARRDLAKAGVPAFETVGAS